MKYLIGKISIFAFLVVTLLYGCDEEGLVGVKVDDGVAPGMLTHVEVEPISGGAIISYKLPSDEDIMGAKVSLIDHNNMERTYTSSIYNSSIKVEGLVKEEPVKIKVVAVDKGGNESKPVTLEVTPKMSPLYNAAKTVTIEPDFGGCRVSFENPTGAALNMFVFVKETDLETGKDSTTLLNTYTFTKKEIKPIVERGFDSVEKEFFVIFKDRWENLSDTVKTNLVPIYEVMIPKDLHSRYWLPHDTPINGGSEPNDPASGGWAPEMLWDGEINYNGGGGLYTLDGAGNDRYDPNPLPEFVDQFDPTRTRAHIFTMDLGAVTKLSRFTYHPSAVGYFVYGGWKVFEMYGTKETPNEDGTMDGWFPILPKTTVETPENHAERKEEIMKNGVNFDFITSDEVRYIRFAWYANYTPILAFVADEVSFFGQVVEE